MTPKRIAPPVARTLAERLTAPPVPVLEGDGEPEALLVREEDKWDATLEEPPLGAGVGVDAPEEPARSRSVKRIRESK